MGKTEQQLKNLILVKYGSLNQFCEKIEISWTTLDSIFKRGITNARIANIIKICSELHIDCESLYQGAIIYRCEINRDTDSFYCTDTEKQLILEYRKADDISKEMILRVLLYNKSTCHNEDT